MAALLVFSWHCVPTRKISATFSLGYVGVGFFFVLSGFILTYTYAAKFADRLDGETVREFYAARFARIYPLHLATMPLMVACLIVLGGNPVWTGVDVQTRALELAAQLVLLQSWFPDPRIHFGGNGPAWSISAEAFFYVMFPLVAWALLRAFRGCGARTVLSAASCVWLLEMLVLAPQHAVLNDWRFYVFPAARLIDFTIGMLVALAFLRCDACAPWRLQATSVELLAAGGAALCIFVSPVLPAPLQFSAALVPAWCCVVFIFAAGRGALSRSLAHPALVRLGEVSFAFYLVHLAIITVVSRMLGWDHPLVLAVSFGASLAASFVLYHGVEQPLRVRIRAALSARRARRAPADALRPAPVLV
ncbi:MAG: acyltransferase family protein [Candidatus Velthaea sp.]